MTGGLIRSYRRFPADKFRLEVADAHASPYIESGRTALRLSYRDSAGGKNGTAELDIPLDLFELLQRFEQGYRPSVADVQGQQLALAVFKNRLAALPYQEVLLTANGHKLRRVYRTEDGVLHMADLAPASVDAAPSQDGNEQAEGTGETAWR